MRTIRRSALLPVLLAGLTLPSSLLADGPGEIGFDPQSAQTTEEAASVTLRIERSRGDDGTVSVDWATVADSAISGEDFVAGSGTLTWGPNDETDRLLQIPVIDDPHAEGDETFRVELSFPTGGAILRDGRETATVVILSSDGGGGTGGGGPGDDGPGDDGPGDDGPGDDGPGEIGLDEDTIEVFEEAGLLFARVERSRGENGTVSVDWETVDGTAFGGTDYVAGSGTLTWGPLDGSDRLLEIELLDDSDAEPSETFEIRLSNPTGGAVLRTGRESSTAVILASDGGTGGGGDDGPGDDGPGDDGPGDDGPGDDGPGDDGPEPGTLKFSSASYQVLEGAASARIVVERSRGEDGAVTVNLQTFPGSATPGEDYDPVAATLEWGPNDGSDRVVTVPVLDDDVAEGNESVSFVLLDPTGGARLGERDVATLTIVDDDPGQAGGASRCAGGEGTLCLQDAKFELTGTWTDFQGSTGEIRSVPITDDSGLFWFFDSSNVELLVKVVDGCGLNDRFWVFVAGTTNVGWRLDVRDVETGTVRTYSNPLGVNSAATTDTEAFASCP